MTMRPVYLMVTQDKYRLPLAVADTKTELAEITGSSLSSICHSIARQRAGKKATGKTNYKYEEVWI